MHALGLRALQLAYYRRSCSRNHNFVNIRTSARPALRSRKLCAEIARKNLQNSRNFGAPRAQNLRALGQRTLRNPQNSVEALHRVCSAFKCKKARVTRQDHANLAPKSREIIAKFLKKFGAPRAHKIACTRPACAETRITSSKLFTKS